MPRHTSVLLITVRVTGGVRAWHLGELVVVQRSIDGIGLERQCVRRESCLQKQRMQSIEGRLLPLVSSSNIELGRTGYTQ